MHQCGLCILLNHLVVGFLHRFLVMGVFRRRKYSKVSEQVLAEMENYGPVTLDLDNQRFLLETDGSWYPDFPALHEDMVRDIRGLRKEKRRLRRELEKHYGEAEELKELKEKINLLDFKYQLMVDMWSTKVDVKGKRHADNEGSTHRSVGRDESRGREESAGREGSAGTSHKVIKSIVTTTEIRRRMGSPNRDNQ